MWHGRPMYSVVGGRRRAPPGRSVAKSNCNPPPPPIPPPRPRVIRPPPPPPKWSSPLTLHVCPPPRRHPHPQALQQHLDRHPLDPHATEWLPRDVAYLARRPPLSATPCTPRLAPAACVLNATAPHLTARPTLPQLLLTALEALLYPPNCPAPRSLRDDDAVQALHSAAAAAIWVPHAALCPPQFPAAADGALTLRVTHAALATLPSAVQAGSARVLLPDALAGALEAQMASGPGGGRGVDVVTYTRPRAQGLAVGPVTLELWDRATGAELAVQGLQDPVTIEWPVNGSQLLLPVEDWYQCVYAVCVGAGLGGQGVGWVPRGLGGCCCVAAEWGLGVYWNGRTPQKEPPPP